MTPKQLDALKAEGLSDTKISQIFGIHPHVVEAVSASNAKEPCLKRDASTLPHGQREALRLSGNRSTFLQIVPPFSQEKGRFLDTPEGQAALSRISAPIEPTKPEFLAISPRSDQHDLDVGT